MLFRLKRNYYAGQISCFLTSAHSTLMSVIQFREKTLLNHSILFITWHIPLSDFMNPKHPLIANLQTLIHNTQPSHFLKLSNYHCYYCMWVQTWKKFMSLYHNWLTLYDSNMLMIFLHISNYGDKNKIKQRKYTWYAGVEIFEQISLASFLKIIELNNVKRRLYIKVHILSLTCVWLDYYIYLDWKDAIENVELLVILSSESE